MLDLRRLRYFATIVELGSISRAASTLGVAQPALSQSIASLESFLGLKLLTRTSSGVLATEAGERLYQHACQIQKQFERAIDDVKSKETAIDGAVVIGLPVSTAAMLSLPILKETLSKHSQIRLQICAIPSQFVAEMLRNSRIDIGIVFDDALTAEFDAEPLLDEELVYMTAPGRLAPGELGTVRLSEIAATSLMIPGTPHGIYKRLISAFELIGKQPHIIAEIDALPSIVEAVTEGLGTAVLPWAALKHAGRPAIDVFRITEPNITRRMYLCHSTISPLSRAAARVRNIVIEQTRALVLSGAWRAATLTV